jgi:hypothetical protein
MARTGGGICRSLPLSCRRRWPEGGCADTFRGWQVDSLEQAAVPSDTRELDVLIARLTRT